ncbi:MAG: hypothetical protein ACTSYB_15685 [Candidatus Helarchaeota archaeon]
MIEGVVADSSFYICLACDLKDVNWLYLFLDVYSFHIGNKLLNELDESLSDNNDFLSRIKLDNYSYYELIKPFFGRNKKHLDDGEYEAIGIAYYLENEGQLNLMQAILVVLILHE